jgi:transposase-like protein
MARRERRTFTREFKAEAVKLCRAGDRSIDVVARDLDLTPTALRAWVKQADVDAGGGETGALTTAERTELQQLRRENKRLTMEREFLKQASAFFARETAPRLR